MLRKLLIYFMLILAGVGMVQAANTTCLIPAAGEASTALAAYGEASLKGTDIDLSGYDVKTGFSRFTNNPYVATLLVALGIIGIVAEVFTVGFGLFGSIGILSFALFFAGRFVAGYAGWAELILIVAGIILLGFEMAVPGFGVPGITGIVCLVMGIIFASPSVEQGILSLVIALVISIGGVIVILKYAPRSKLFDHIILHDKQQNDLGYVSQQADPEAWIGLEGEAVTHLRPAGTVLVKDAKIDVVSDGEYIPKGSRVKIETVDGNRVVVRKI